ncbi:S41 family peptidase [Aquimarina longa]|uniref:S41 family peptidase n=1 Tax=Aquimarina longa TaxID=1080221 RepID=UPI0007855CD9|nr:S41 family peptidase [Aquimarina longa]
MKYIKYFTLLLVIISSFTACFNDNDDVRRVSDNTEINSFIWKGMNTFYLYKEEVPNLANNRFSSTQKFQEFLRSFASPEAIFEALQTQRTVAVGTEQKKADEFSFLVNDYVKLEQAFDGITRNNGMEYRLIRYPNNASNVFGYVRYVLPDTDAEAKGIKRGDIFTTINGTQITDKNFKQLLEPDNYTIGLATFDGSNFTSTGASLSLTKVQYTENPIFISKTIDVGGNPVGYLMYNSFTGDFDQQLNAAFGKFSSDKVTDLILDLRYNGGGAVTSAIDLSSMITGQFKGKVFSTEQWNSDRQDALGNTNLFDDKIRNNDAINSLNLTRVYVLTSRSSASASELVINGLNPYINVIQIGATTRGKFQASITLYDSKNFRRKDANTGHTYAMQPLVLKSLNSVGFTDYYSGFTPSVEVKEDISNPGGVSNLGVLGDPNEPMLKAAINHILGIKSLKKNSIALELESIGDSKMFSPTYERMYQDLDVTTIEQSDF